MATGIDLIISCICNATFCESVYDNPLLDHEITKKESEYLALKQDINGKHIKVATYNNFPLSWVEKINNGTLVGRGVAFIIIDILSEKFNFTYEIVLPEKNYLLGRGNDKPEQSVIGLLKNELVDMAAVFMPKMPEFQKLLSYSNDLDEGVWMMMLKRPKESAAGSGLLAPFENHVWYLILAAVLSYGPCITFLTRLRSKLVRDDQKYIPLSPSIWFVYGAFIKQGTTLAPEANTTRVLFATWWMFIILLSAFYTANLTAFLTLSKFTLDIESPQDLYKKHYRWFAPEGSPVEYVINNPDEELFYLSRMVSEGRVDFRNVDHSQDYLPLVAAGMVLVKEQTSIDHLMYDDYLSKAKEGVDEADRCTYVVAPTPFMKRIRGFAYPKDSYLKMLFDPVLSYVMQSGIVDFLEYRDLPSTKICPLDLQSKDRQLRNSDLVMTYMIMAVGLSAAIAVFIGEVIIKRFFIIRRKGDKSRKKKVRINKNLKTYSYDNSRPPPYESLFGRNSRYKNTENSQRKIINGREYWIVDTVSGDTRLIPVRTPSAFLYQRNK